MTTSNEITLRRFRRADLPAVRRLLVRTMDESFSPMYPPSAIGYFKNHHKAEHILADAKGGYTVVVERSGRIIATGTLIDGRIHRVYVDPPRQGRGLGKWIMAHLEERAKAAGLDRLLLHSTLAARRFYESLGYAVQAGKSLTMGDGKRLDYFDMTKQLKDKPRLGRNRQRRQARRR